MLITWFIGAWAVIALIWLCGCPAPDPNVAILLDDSSDDSDSQTKPSSIAKTHLSSSIPPEQLIDAEELEQISDWIAMSVRQFKRELIDHEALVGTVTTMVDRMHSIRAKRSTRKAA